MSVAQPRGSELVRLRMSSGNGPTVDGALLTKDLRERRHARGEKQEAVAKALEWSRSKFMRIESGTVPISKTDLEALLRHYEVDDDEVVLNLTNLARGAKAPAWWHKHTFNDKAFEAYVGFEAGASSIRMSQGLLVPGVLQTEAYARIMAQTYVPPENIQAVVDLRLDRQENIFERAPQQRHVLDEAVIRRRIGNAMPSQLQHLMELADRPEIDIRIIPFHAGPHFGMRGPFALLGFDVDLDDVLFLESSRRGDLLIPPLDVASAVSGSSVAEAPAMVDEIAEYQEAFETLFALALEPQESMKFIERVAHEMGR
jgi:transcriptional regulator with XRE-family HTH domain